MRISLPRISENHECESGPVSRHSLPRLEIRQVHRPAPKEIPPHKVNAFLSLMRSSPPIPPPPKETDMEYSAISQSLLFTINEQEELLQRREIVGSLVSAHGEALDRWSDDLRNAELKQEVQRCAANRQENCEALGRILVGRSVRREFRKDFKDYLEIDPELF
ncbi:hypothetical protein F5Y16DRAFT_404595 [Xylariaceae sp. FL0255]|nr:hypothetical protein F5Y16DRAFT_404595 [Xylariaceae sp. FL0255]